MTFPVPKKGQNDASTSEQRLEWARLSAAATPGPWHVVEHPRHTYSVMTALDGKTVARQLWTEVVDFDRGETFSPDAEFIAAARDAVPVLLAENEQLRAQIAGVVDALLTGGQSADIRCRLAMQALATSVEVLS